MRDSKWNRAMRGHLLPPAFLLLATLALAIPVGVSHLREPHVDLVASVSVQREVAELRQLADGGSCRLLTAVVQADGLSSGFVSVMLRFTEALDRVSRDAAGFMAWVENLMEHDSLDALEVAMEGVAGWFAGSLDPPQCVDASVPSPLALPESGAPVHS